MKHIRCNDITKALLALTAFLFFSTQGRAQFTIKENFMGSSVGVILSWAEQEPATRMPI
jgi:hypothetical protein